MYSVSGWMSLKMTLWVLSMHLDGFDGGWSFNNYWLLARMRGVARVFPLFYVKSLRETYVICFLCTNVKPLTSKKCSFSK